MQKGHFARKKKNVALYWLGQYQTQVAVCAESLMRKWF